VQFDIAAGSSHHPLQRRSVAENLFDRGGKQRRLSAQ
jgi:hypothetical protein